MQSSAMKGGIFPVFFEFFIKIEAFLKFQVGGAVSLGEQPIKMLINAEKGARMCISETIMNLVWAPITDLKVQTTRFIRK